MILRAAYVGELVTSLLTHTSEGRVSRVFRSSAYIEAEGEMILLLRGALRSPMTVNLPAAEDFGRLLAIDERCDLGLGRLKFGRMTVRTEGANVYHGGLARDSSIAPLAESELVRGVVMLRLLYGASQSKLDFFTDGSFRRFIRTVLLPLAGGKMAEAYLPRNYLPLIGLGGGFTPAGDDFVGGFAAAFNYVARTTGRAEIRLPKPELEKRTVPESAALIDYAQRGYVDEELERLIISAFGGRPGFFDNLLQVARRGHTSGIDVSSGVLLSAAVCRDSMTREGAVERCLAALANP
ncbi:MAG: DUF2877 domain-containing protein [Nitrososphaerales archaeon]|jgi:hypothetical protein